MRKVLQLLAHWINNLAPGLAVLAVLGIVVIGSTTLVSEANGGTNMDASVLGVADISTHAPCKIAGDTTNSDTSFCTSFCQDESKYQVKGRLQKVSTVDVLVRVECPLGTPLTSCTILRGEKTCVSSPEEYSGSRVAGRCGFEGNTENKRVRAMCKTVN